MDAVWNSLLYSVDNLVSFANRKITVWLSFEERMDCLLFVHVINSCEGRVGVTGISLILDNFGLGKGDLLTGTGI